MIILIELTLCINTIINFFVIKCSALSCGQRAKFAFIASLFGAFIALVMPLFSIGKIANILIQILLSSAMCLFCFQLKPLKKFLLTYSLFLGYTFLFGGACLAFQNAFGQLPLIAVLSIACAVYIVCRIVIKVQNKVKQLKKFSFKVCLTSKENTVEEEGFLDSGNVLYDPVTKQPIILITYDIFSKLQPGIDYVSAYCKNVNTKKLQNGHYVKINTVASGTSILVFTIDKVEIFEGEQKRDYKNIAVGLSFSGFNNALGRKILLHRELA